MSGYPETRSRVLAAVLAALALVATFLLPAAPASAAGSSITPASASVAIGSTLTVQYETDAPHDKNWIAVYRASDGTPDGDPASRVYAYAPEASGSVSLSLSSSRFAAGEYLIYFLAQDGYGQLTAPVALTVTDVPSAASISLSASTLEENGTLTVNYSVPTAGALNWIGLYSTTAGYPDGNPGSILWSYAPDTSGSISFELTDRFAPGTYLAYFLANDGYVSLADPAPFTVTAGPDSLAALVSAYEAVDGRVGDAYSVKVDEFFRWSGATAPALTLEDAPAWASLVDGVLVGTPTGPGRATATVAATLGDLTAEVIVTLPIVDQVAARGDDLTIVTYNAWHQGGQVSGGRAKELQAFLEQGADVVALQESSTAHANSLADDLGWFVYTSGGDCTIISRYPIGEDVVSSAAGAARILVDEAHDRSVWVMSAHLGYTRYGPYYAQEGRTVEYILSEENVQRGPQVRANLATIAQLEADYPGVPIVYAGDLNTPSHLDWVEENKAQHGGLIVPWPVSTELHAAGFSDTFREIHPDPITDPATSWTPRFLDEPQDRIDFIYLKGSELDTVDSRYFHGESMSDWASDHGAFATDVRWADAAPAEPELELSASTIEEGEELVIDYVVTDPKPLNWVGIYSKGATPGIQSALAYQYVPDTGGTLRWDGTETGGWTVQGATPPGEYDIYLFEDDGYGVLAGPVSFTITKAAVPEPLPQTGGTSELRVLTWNIYHGGLDDDNDDAENRQAAAEYIADLEPDVFVAIETYGAAETILTELNDNADGRVYTGTRITQASNDNLWIFSRLPIVEVLDAPSGLGVNDFNLGGIRVRLDNNREVTLYDVWSSYTDPWIGDLIEENAQDAQAGDPLRHSEADILDADQVQSASIADFLAYAEQHSGGEDDVAIIGGDLNTVSSEDWDARWASCPSHYGLSYELTATRQFATAGYADAFRVANPDACAAPGVTWSPRLEMDTPDRIDFSFVRGSGVTVEEASILDDRLPVHGDGEFYSDHAAVVIDYLVPSVGDVDGPGDGGAGGTPAVPGALAMTGVVFPLGVLALGGLLSGAGALVFMTRRRHAAQM